MADKIAPVQGYTPGIPWEMHLRAYDAYRKKYGAQQALIEGWCRGGFGTSELDEFIPGWREELSERAAMRREIEQLKRERDGERDQRDRLADALRAKDQAMGILFDRLAKAGVDCSDLFS